MSVQLDSAFGERLKFGQFEFVPVARTLWRRGKQVKLGSRALDILIALDSRQRRVLHTSWEAQTGSPPARPAYRALVRNVLAWVPAQRGPHDSGLIGDKIEQGS
jgi:hypothetical protein